MSAVSCGMVFFLLVGAEYWPFVDLWDGRELDGWIGSGRPQKQL